MAKNKSKNINIKKILTLIIIIIIGLALEYINSNISNKTNASENENTQIANYSNIIEVPEYTNQIFVELNNNIPYFNEEDYTTQTFEKYSDLDEKGRCGVAYANICKETMPLEGDKRGDISRVKPTGWEQKKYDGEYLYNRCHLIGYQLSDEDANELNLITGTRYFNVSGMLPFENKVAEYQRK